VTTYTHQSTPTPPRVPIMPDSSTLVPEPFGPPIADMAWRYVEEVMDNLLTGDDIACEAEVEEIENESRSGFIPYTEGGFEAVGWNTLGYAHSSGKEPKAIQPIIESALCDCLEWFLKDRDGFTMPDNVQDKKHGWERYNYLWEAAEKQLGEQTFGPMDQEPKWIEEYYEVEHEYLLEGSTYFWKCRAIFYDATNSDNELDGDAILFETYLNTDLEYGRDYVSWLSCYGASPDQTVDGYRKWVLVKDMTEALVDQMLSETADAIAAMY
jgi:hypothetical protein